MKKKVEIVYPFIQFETNYKHLFFITSVGNPVFYIEITNPVKEYSADEKSYLNFHATLNNIVKILGENMILHKTDVISKSKYQPKVFDNYLKNAYQQHFDGRVFKQMKTVLSLTFLVDRKYSHNEQKINIFINKIDKILQILEEDNFSPKALRKEEILEFVNRQLCLNFNSNAYSFDNFKGFDNCLKSNDKYIKTIKLIDTENVILPSDVSPFLNQKGVALDKEYPVDFVNIINGVDDFEYLIYNQIIHIPPQLKMVRMLEQKRNRAASIKDPLNDITFNDIENVLSDIAKNNQLLVYSSFTLGICAKDEVELNKTFNKIESGFFMQGVSISKNSFNQMQLFESSVTGNSNKIFDKDLFLTTSDVALCFFFKESYRLDDAGTISHFYANRQGVPIMVDPVELPMKKGLIANRNGLVIGGSGTGKSFNMNNKLEQEYNNGNDIVIIDVGHSYSNLCEYCNGRYITHSEEEPITMNPFKISLSEYNLEKIDFLIGLICTIYNNNRSGISTFEINIIRECVTGFYKSYFEDDGVDFEDKENDFIEAFINENEDFEKNKYWESAKKKYDMEHSDENYYRVLGLGSDASDDDIRESYRRLIKENHPDVKDDNNDEAVKIIEAYTVLSNKKKKKIYDDVSTEVVIYSTADNQNYNFLQLQKIYTSLIKRRAADLANKLKVSELSFNSFYEYAEIKIPQIIKKREKSRIDNERNFSSTVFFTNLSPFYKGGLFDRILNEDVDTSLFNERFIVFEIDNIQGNKQLFPIVILIIMDLFTQKMRLRNCRKTLVIEEAWKAVTNAQMAEYIKYLFKTVRKFYGAVWVVSQEIDDLVGNDIVKDAIVNNADTTILMEQSKYANKFKPIADLLGIDEVDERKIFTINQLDNKKGRAYFKEFYMKVGTKGDVYGVEVSSQQYMVYTTEFPEKKIINIFKDALHNDLEKALDEITYIQKELNTDIKTTLSILYAFLEYIPPRYISYLKDLYKEKGNKIQQYIINEKDSKQTVETILNINKIAV